MRCEKKVCSLKNYAVDAYKNALRKINFPKYKYFEDVNHAYSDLFQKLMLHPVRLSESKGIHKIGLLKKYLKNLRKGTNSLKHLRKQDFLSIKNYIKRLNTMQKSQSDKKESIL